MWPAGCMSSSRGTMHSYAVDLETTGLDPKRDRILAFAYVKIGERTVKFGERVLVRMDSVGASAQIHGLLPVDLAKGMDEYALAARIGRLVEEGVIVTFGRHDVEFIRALLRRYGYRAVIRFVDIMQVLMELPSMRMEAASRLRLTLYDAARRLLGISPEEAHDPLEDALLTALLFLKFRGLAKVRRINTHGILL